MVSRPPIRITRRYFVRLALVSAAATWAEAACAGPAVTTPATPAASQASATPSATRPHLITVAPTASPLPETVPTFPPLTNDTPVLLQNRNDRHYNVRYVNPFPPVDHDAWRLEVKGLVETPGSFSLADLLAWPQIEHISRMQCVEGWSFQAQWGGFDYDTLSERVRPRPQATYVRFDCADAYWEIVSIEELAAPRVTFVLRMNDEILLDEYGAPLRMVFPSKYGYKSAKAVTSITFSDQGGPGYWSSIGGYSADGEI